MEMGLVWGTFRFCSNTTKDACEWEQGQWWSATSKSVQVLQEGSMVNMIHTSRQGTNKVLVTSRPIGAVLLLSTGHWTLNIGLWASGVVLSTGYHMHMSCDWRLHTVYTEFIWLSSQVASNSAHFFLPLLIIGSLPCKLVSYWHISCYSCVFLSPHHVLFFQLSDPSQLLHVQKDTIDILQS
jgi:hypothetical protein